MDKIFDVAIKLPWIKSLTVSNDDNHSDRLNHRYTTSFLLMCATMATGASFVFSRITCWVPANFVGAYSTYANNYCWIANTYYIPSNVTVPHSKYDRDKAEIGYYQWAPFIFLISAFFFYLPRMLWRSLNMRSGIDIENLFKHDAVAPIAGSIQYYCQPADIDRGRGSRFFRSLSCTGGKRIGNYLVVLYVFTKILYLTNSILQLIVFQIILGQPGWFYGLDIWYSVFIKNSVLTDSPYFPRVTLCDLRVREVGNIHRYTVQCVLPINMFNEKTFALAWFWLFYVCFVNIISFITTLFQLLIPSRRIQFIRDLYLASPSDSDDYDDGIERFTNFFLQQDGTLILSLIKNNGRAFLAEDVAKVLFDKYKEKRPKPKPRRNKWDPELESTVV